MNRSPRLRGGALRVVPKAREWEVVFRVWASSREQALALIAAEPGIGVSRYVHDVREVKTDAST